MYTACGACAALCLHRATDRKGREVGAGATTPKGRHGAASCAHGRRHRCPLASLSRFPLQWTRLLPRPHVAVSVTPGKTRMLAHQAEWSLLSGRDGILDRSRNGQVRRSSREARRQRDGGHGQQEPTPQRLAPARWTRGRRSSWVWRLGQPVDHTRGQNMKESSSEPRVFTAPKGHCPWSHPTQHVCAVERTKAEAFGGVTGPAGKQPARQVRRKPTGEHSRRLAPKEHS
jgi:hypothetical protein